ncbi:hypothetical protein [Demequina sp. NBRC 110056]|uniref:hypothetical protein n=1 Tax=Demequina sp. NBRC 110056 TaxID=1570345 RepID=UPI0009FBBADA|nr:hypothetical protein [Demequina sp. NBRC 110056]
MHTRNRAAIGALMLAGAVALAGCSNPLDGLAEEGLERVVEEAVEGEGELDINLGGDATLPSTWPSDLPEPPGSLMASFGVEGGGTATFEVPSEDEVIAYVAEVEAAGFTPETEASTGLEIVVLQSDAWLVSIGWIAEEGAVVGTVTYAPAEGGAS